MIERSPVLATVSSLRSSSSSRRSTAGATRSRNAYSTRPLTITNGPLYFGNMRRRHPKPEVEEALMFAEEHAWVVRYTAAGHKWGDMRCVESSREGCLESIWSTPKSPGNHAKRLKARVRNCPHGETSDE